MAPFDSQKPPAQDFSSLDWARWTFWDRTASKMTEAQVDARLMLHVQVVDGVTYYRPLAAAADYILTPDRMVQRDRNAIQERYVDPLAIAREWRELQARLDEQMPQPKSADGTTPEGNLDLSIEWRSW